VRLGNFTPPDRTPWGGHRILTKYKAGLRTGVDPAVKVGESWEVSTEPSFPSLLENGEHLAGAISRDPVGWLGAKMAARYEGQNPSLVKLVDAETTLSVQVHPPEQHSLLAADESGKTEAWIVLDADPDTAIYLGFRQAVTRALVEQHLRTGDSIEPLMNRVPVSPGDVFFINPGTVHALGAGVTVLEPQRVRPGRKAVTYRFWDWNRRFDAGGNIDPRGTPRPLHIQEALEVTAWDALTTSSEVERCTRIPVIVSRTDASQIATLVDEPELFVQEYTGTISRELDSGNGMLAVLCLSGRLELAGQSHDLILDAGRTAVVPSAAAGTRLSLDAGRAVVCATPA
jgi:mannose-6-phosphate isomerase